MASPNNNPIVTTGRNASNGPVFSIPNKLPINRKLIKGEKVQSLEKTVLDQRGEINGSRRKLN
ncbi:hypothetical protein, partial [Staphylococcus hominis]|uniref:hypothetical protein n=1 Tax=Staphylococcus hominis TaxID=1290 RepID=UPI003D0488E7